MNERRQSVREDMDSVVVGYAIFTVAQFALSLLVSTVPRPDILFSVSVLASWVVARIAVSAAQDELLRRHEAKQERLRAASILKAERDWLASLNSPDSKHPPTSDNAN